MMNFKKRITKKATIYEETYLNITQSANNNMSILRLAALGKVRIYKGVKHFSIGLLTKHLCFSFAECKIDLLQGHDIPFLHVAPGDIVFVKPGYNLKYRLTNDTSTDCLRLYVLIQCNPYIEQMFGLNEIGIIKSRNPERVHWIMQELLQMVQNSTRYSEADFSIKLFEFFTYLCDSPLPVQRIFNKYSDLFHFVETYPQNYSNLTELMDFFGMSRNTLNRLFLKHTGKSPMEFIIYSRLLNSCWQLRQTEMPIAEIAAINGYKSAAFFSNAFKTLFGLSPSKYRKEEQSNAGPHFGQLRLPQD